MKPGGRVVMDSWRREVSDWFATNAAVAALRKETLFGGLYQILTITR